MRLSGKPIEPHFFCFTPFLNHFAMLGGKIFCKLQEFSELTFLYSYFCYNIDI